MLLQQIAESPPPRPRTVNAAVPADLETIVLKAIAREAPQRYATAGELADDLRRFLEDRPIRARRLGIVERSWRRARRNRVVAALSGLAVSLLLLVTVVATVGYVRISRANARAQEALTGQSQQRERAEAISALTLETLDDIFEQYVPNRVAGNAQLTLHDAEGPASGMTVQPVLSKGAAALLERMLACYVRLAEQNASDPRLRRKVADANRRIGDIHRRMGHCESAQAAYLTAIEQYERLRGEQADDHALPIEIARIYNELGDLHWAAHWQGDGQSYHATALNRLMAAPAAQVPLDPQRYELARTHYFLGRGAPPEGDPGRRAPVDGPRHTRDAPPDRPASPTRAAECGEHGTSASSGGNPRAAVGRASDRGSVPAPAGLLLP